MFVDQILSWLSRFASDNFRADSLLLDSGQSTVNLSTIGSWVVLFLVLLVVFIYFLRKTRIFEWISKHILSFAIVVWLWGVVVYIVGFYNGEVSGLSVVLRAIIASFKMFVVSNELARVVPQLHSDALYMTMFAVVHFVAAFITFLFIFKMIGYKIKSYIDIVVCRYWHSKGRRVHIFWGINQASQLLAQSIRRQLKSDIIIFVDVDKEGGEASNKQSSISTITNMITIRNSDIVNLDAIGALVDHCYGGPAAVSEAEANKVFKALHLRNIAQIVRKSSKTNLYLLSEDEGENIAGALNLQKDTILNTLGRGRVEIYVHARRRACDDVLNVSSQSQCNINIVDSAYLAVQTLKCSESALPVSCVDIDTKTGLVDTPFNSLIIGFGTTGQEAFKFLYEFSAFVDSKLQRSKFCCHVVDEKMDSIAGLVRAQMPAITEDELVLIKTSVNSVEFWQRIEKIISELNYVVITLNNDNLGLSTAVNLFKYALKCRNTSSPMLKIMLRCYDSRNQARMKEVIGGLNSSTEGSNVKINLFGLNSELYDYRLIVSDATICQAMEFNRIYENSTLTAEEQWQENFGPEAVETIISKGYNRYHAVCEINRKVSQNISNALHCTTKLMLMGLDTDKATERLKLFCGYVATRKSGTTTYQCDTPEQRLLLNMAIVEHERWVASHKLMGYTFGEKSSASKQHPCICSWDSLDQTTQSYDCNVVDTTIKLAYEQLSSK